VQDAFLILKKRIDDGTAPHTSPTDLYDAWIDSAEACYAQVAHGESFARLLGELANIYSAIKIERAKLTEQIARHFGLPSRAEVDTLHRQVRALSSAARGNLARKPRKPRGRTRK
jgi:hypothetical protein